MFHKQDRKSLPETKSVEQLLAEIDCLLAQVSTEKSKGRLGLPTQASNA